MRSPNLTGGARPYALLLGLCLALFLPGLSGLPPTDRDESRYAQASKQMLESHDFVRIQFQDESRAKKPVGIYWLQAASAALTGRADAIWSYRLPSLAGATLAVLLCFALGQRLVGRKEALIGAAFLASSVLLVTEAHQAKTDAALLAAVVAAQGLLGRFYLTRDDDGPGFWPAMGFWLAQGAGILIKGPILPMVSGMTIVALVLMDRRGAWLRRLRPVTGVALSGLMVAPWLWAISHATAGKFIGQAVKTDLLPKLLGGQEAHGAAPGTYLLLLSLSFWPASLFVIAALPTALRDWRQPSIRFLLAWLVPNWLIFEAIPTKLPNYILPLYPALALLAALWLSRQDGLRPIIWQRLYALIWGGVTLAISIGFVALPVALKMPPFWDLAPLALALILLGLFPLWLFWRGAFRKACYAALTLAVLAYGALFLLLPERLAPLWISRAIAAQVPRGDPLVAAGYHEPSLVFLHGTGTLLTDGGAAADFLAQNDHGWAAIESSEQSGFETELAKLGRSATASAVIDGFNPVRGKKAHITLWRLEP